MGCGPSKPATKGGGPATAQLESAGSVFKPVSDVSNVKLVETNTTETTDATSSRDTTPTQQKEGPLLSTSKRRAGAASLADRRKSASVERSKSVLPSQDFTGLKLVHRENDQLKHITTLATTILKAQVAFVVLGASDHMVLVSSVGLEPEDDAWLPGICAWGSAMGDITIENLEEDKRSKGLPWVQGDPAMKFFASAAVNGAEGEWIGVLCVLDFESKPGSTPLCTALGNLAEMVERELPNTEAEPKAESLLLRAMDTYWDGSVLVNTKVGRWRVKYANETFGRMTGIDNKKAPGKDLWDLLDLCGSAATAKPWERHASKCQKMDTFELYPVVASQSEINSRTTAGSERKTVFKVQMRPNTKAIMENYGVAPREEDIDGWYFAVVTFLVTNSRGSYAPSSALDADFVPFEGAELGPIIGKGSFGSVYRAVWSEKIVAIKIVGFGDITRVDSEGDPLEASLMMKMKHPNIVETLKYTTQQRGDGSEIQASPGGGSSSSPATTPLQSAKSGTLESWLMLEFCDLGTLSDGVNSGLFHKTIAAGGGEQVNVPKMTVVLETALDIALGLEFIHSHSILHGDLTAGNVLLASIKDDRGKKNFQAKIADFGLSRQAITSKVETNTYGTVTHMPPELLNEGILSKAADVYAFGVLLFEIFTRKPVWEGLRHPQIIHAIAVQKKHPELPDSAPKNFKDLAYSCMTSDHEARPDFPTIITEIRAMLEVKV